MKVSRTLIVVGSLLLILSIVLTYKWIAYNHAYPKAQTDMGVDSNQTTAVIDPSETGVIMNWNSNNKKVSSVQ